MGGKRAVVERQEKWKLKPTHCGSPAFLASFLRVWPPVSITQRLSNQLPHGGKRMNDCYTFSTLDYYEIIMSSVCQLSSVDIFKCIHVHISFVAGYCLI